MNARATLLLVACALTSFGQRSSLAPAPVQDDGLMEQAGDVLITFGDGHAGGRCFHGGVYSGDGAADVAVAVAGLAMAEAVRDGVATTVRPASPPFPIARTVPACGPYS